MKDFNQYLKIVNENTGAERLKRSNRAIDESELRMLKNMFAKSPNNKELGRRIKDLESAMTTEPIKEQPKELSTTLKKKLKKAGLSHGEEYDEYNEGKVAIKKGDSVKENPRMKDFGFKDKIGKVKSVSDNGVYVVKFGKEEQEYHDNEIVKVNESMDQTFNDAENLAAILIDTFKDIESLYPQMEAEIMNIVMSNPGHMYKQKIDEISRKFNIDRKLVEEAFSDFGCNINESDSGIIRLFKSRLMKEYIKDIDKNDIKTKSKNKTVKTSHRSDDYAINRVELKDGTVGYVWSDDQKLDESEETLGGLVPVQSGEVIKLQKPAPETYINKVMNNDNVEIADCTVCGADHVIVGEHICKTVLDTSDQVPSEFNMTESISVNLTKEVQEQILNDFKTWSGGKLPNEVPYDWTDENPDDDQPNVHFYLEHAVEFGKYNASKLDIIEFVLAQHLNTDVTDTEVNNYLSDYDLNENRFLSIRAKYGINETKMITKIEWFKNILESNTVARKGTFSDSDGNQYDGYTFGENWNGFAVPYFEKSVALNIAIALGGTFDADKNSYVFEEESDEEYVSQLINTVDGEKNVYPIGAYSWVWSEDEN